MAESYIDLLPEVRAFLSADLPLYADGQRVSAQGGRTFATVDPSRGTELARVAEAQPEDVDRAVRAARAAFDAGRWHLALSPGERAARLWRLADLIEAHAEALAQLDSLDSGKPFAAIRDGDLPLAVEHLRYYAGWPTKLEGRTVPVNRAGMLNYTLREPVGVCGLIVPWNYPLLMAMWKLAPALAAGNCVVLKPAEQTPLSVLYLAELTAQAGFPRGVYNVVPGFGPTAGGALVDHPQVDKISFTGSVQVARQIVQASAADLKRVSLELGGKSPNIVFADADLERAALGALWAGFGNNGQSCTAGARLYVERPAFERLLRRMGDEAKRIRVGPGMSAQQPDLGPVVSQAQLERILGYIDEGVQSGGEVVTGGRRLAGELAGGYFVAPTIFANVSDEDRIAREEIFGPVVCAMPFDDPGEVLQRANRSPYGLAAGVWTRDVGKAHRLAGALRAGTVWVNTWGDTDAASPFGGYKQSGYGREMGAPALDLYTELKSVWVNHG